MTIINDDKAKEAVERAISALKTILELRGENIKEALVILADDERQVSILQAIQTGLDENTEIVKILDSIDWYTMELIKDVDGNPVKRIPGGE